MFPIGLRYHTVHVNNNCAATLACRTDTACQIEVVVGILTCFVAYGVGVEHLAVDADCTSESGHYDAIALAQIGVVVAARSR